MSYKNRYKSKVKQAAYENACDCMYYGMSSKEWNSCLLDLEEKKEVWKLAFWDVAEPDIEHGRMDGDTYKFSV